MSFEIDARIAEWRKSLLDTTRRNPLIKFVAGRGGGVNFFHPAAADVWGRLVRDGSVLSFPWKRTLLGLPAEVIDAETLGCDSDSGRGSDDPGAAEVARELTEHCLKSPNLKPTHVVTEYADSILAARLTRLSRKAREAETEHGVTTLFAAFGFLRWTERDDPTAELLSPLLLVPVRLDRESVEAEYTLRAEDEILPNHCLAELLRSEFRIHLPAAGETPVDPDAPDGLEKYLQAVAETVRHVADWELIPAASLGVFNFQKLAMWEDLGRNANRVREHSLCRAIAGDPAISLSPPEGLPVAADLDRVVPSEAAFHILDADSSQHEAIEAAKGGADLVMDGPPGTGKSQTIANMIAAALATGKTVLFVSEKTAALEVVKRRLDRCGLGDFCLELHSHKASKKLVLSELARCLDLTPHGVPDVGLRVRQLGDDRHKLNEYVAELHAPRPALGWSAFRVHGELARLGASASRSRLAVKDPLAQGEDYVRRGAEILTGLADCRSVLQDPAGHPWRGCKLTTYSQTLRDDVEYAVGRLADITPPAVKACSELAARGFGSPPFTVASWWNAEDDSRRVNGADIYPSEWFHADPRAAAAAVVELDRATRDVRSLVARFPEFDADAVRRIGDPSVLAGLDPDRERLAGRGIGTRERGVVLGRVEVMLRSLARLAAEADRTARHVAGLLHMSRTPGTDHLVELSGVAGVIAEGPPIPPEWWDASRRTELIAAIAHAAEQDRAAQSAKAELATRLAPAAFAPESLTLVLEASAAAASFWKRLLPGWWKRKKRVAVWYADSIPGTGNLRADLAALADFHRRTVGVRQIYAQNAADLATGLDGKPDWTVSLARVRAVEWLERLGVQHTFRAAAGPRKMMDRTTLGTAATSLAQQAAAFRDGWAKLMSEFAIPYPAAILAKPASEVAAWLTLEAGACRREADSLAVLVAAMLPGREPPPEAVLERASDLRRLVESRALIGNAAGVVNDTRAMEELEEVDHSTAATLAQSLLKCLSGLSRRVTPGIAAALSDPEARTLLGAALKQSEAARRPFAKAWEKVTADLFDPDADVSTKVVLSHLPLEEVGAWATARSGDTERLAEWAHFAMVKAEAAGFGVDAVVEEVEAGEIAPESAADAFRVRFFRLWLDALHQQSPALAGFATESHERLIARFADLDRLAIRTAPDQIRGQLLTNPSRPRTREGAPEASELGILLREVNKKRRHLPLRRLFAQIPSILPRIKPCLMMSPLATSTYLDTPELSFDLVIFDEASQIRPHESICAIYRGRQLVVGGDPKQLPPTDFFTRNDAEDDESPTADDGMTGFESLLDVCLSLGLNRKRLRWHYRSRREDLIAFSNRYFYDQRLVTFPSTEEGDQSGVRFLHVSTGRFENGVNSIEAKEVAALVMEHARATPNVSLGVIAFSLRQQDRILDELDVLRRQSPATESFFGQGRDDPFFVKNLENVQGDERDVIVLSVGYGPDDEGKVAMRFGPLNRLGGERRLNVAVTRARRGMIVVSSITAADIDLARTGAEGAKLLRAFLDYAARGAAALATSADDSAEPVSPFEIAVADELGRRGLVVHRRVGCGGYRLDLAITDPDYGKQYLLGVECDGANYHAAATARDRDRLRQSVLEGLGWKLVRVWSTDWVRDMENQVRRVLAALELAKRPSGLQPARAPAPEVLPTVRWKPGRPTAFESIELVPDVALGEAITATLSDYGSMPVEDLVAAVSRRLGFKRTGPKIRERIVEGINARTGSIVVLGADGRVRPAPSRRL